MQEALLLAEAKSEAVANRTVYIPPPVVADNSTVATDLADQIRSNPLINMEWLSVEEQASLNDSLEVVKVSQKSSKEARGEVDPFVPSLPSRHAEWEVSKMEACMWRIPNISTLAPISREMWQAWGTISDAEVDVCCQNALKGVTLFETNPPYLTKWPIKIFGPPKYKCNYAAGAKVRGNLVTTCNQIEDHKGKLWGWHRPYFCCSCYNGYNNGVQTGCYGQLIWLDHAVWYMLNHLDVFFSASAIQGRFVMLMGFLSGEARKMVLDHLRFCSCDD
ncbi:unnamed protein product [Calypogeia fissa]